METQTDTPSAAFAPGTPVIYALHGKCSVLAIETRQVGQEQIRFYKLEVQKPALSRSMRQEPAIWLPVSSAREKGLRAPMDRKQAEAAMAALTGREYFFSLSEPWNVVQPKLETTIRTEGGLGLAKAVSYLHVLKRKQIVPTTEVARFFEAVHKVLMRELSEALSEPIRALEEKIARGVKSKLLPDH